MIKAYCDLCGNRISTERKNIIPEYTHLDLNLKDSYIPLGSIKLSMGYKGPSTRRLCLDCFVATISDWAESKKVNRGMLNEKSKM
jgi:hypothetical protein